MTEREFQTQIFKTADQWRSGLLFRLQEDLGGGITLPALPAEAEALPGLGEVPEPVVLAVDGCGLVYFLDEIRHRVGQYDPRTQVVEWLPYLCQLHKPGRLLFHGLRMFLVDAAAQRVWVYSRLNGQIILELAINQPRDVVIHANGSITILDGQTNCLHRFAAHGGYLDSYGGEESRAPVGCVIGREDSLVLLDRDTRQFLRFSATGKDLGAFGNLDGIIPQMLARGPQWSFFVLSEIGEVWQLDQDGLPAGRIKLPPEAGEVRWIATDRGGRLYASTRKGVFAFTAALTFSREQGTYYSKTLDSGLTGCRWHRLRLTGDFPPGTAVEISACATDDTALQSTIQHILADPDLPMVEKVAALERHLQWSQPRRNAKDMLLQAQPGRYLWLKITLATFDERVRPNISEMRLFYPRQSYLRYLPAIYQQDGASRDFLERFLSLFESIFADLENDIATVTRFFDPDTTPPEFLGWLGSWLSLALEEDWPEETRRQLIREAPDLYSIKGTVAGIRRVVELLTGKTPVIMEAAQAGEPLTLGGEHHLGVNSLLLGAPRHGFKLGQGSILGRVHLGESLPEGADPFLQAAAPFLPLAYHFTVYLDLTPAERDRYLKGLRQLLNEVKPAHTTYSLRLSDTAGTRPPRIGINFTLAGFSRLRLGEATVGGAWLLGMVEEGGVVGERAALGQQTRLIA